MPDCPKCGKRMIKNGGERGKPRFACYTLEGTKKLYCYSTTKRDNSVVRTQSGKVTRPRHKTPIFKRTLGSTQRFIVTAAQNATPVHTKFLKSLEIACNHLNAELLVIPIRYKNPTSRWSASQSNDETWDSKVVPYLWNTRKALNKNLIVLGDIKTQPTASAPLTGFDAITGAESGILGHTKLQLRCIPTPSHKLPKILTTTGAVTVANYTDSRAGKLGEFHHTLGAAMVEIQGKKFHLRQLNADKEDGVFYDLDKIYGANWMNDGIAPSPIAAGLILGDVHVGAVDPAVERATFDTGGIVDTLRPRIVAYNDLFDGYGPNPHHHGNVFVELAKIMAGKGSIEKEVEEALLYVMNRTRPETKAVIVPSNHDDFLRRWVLNTDWRSDPKNAAFYLKTAAAMIARTKMGPGGAEYPSPFIYWAKQKLENLPLKDRTFKVLEPDESYTISGIEIGMHGDRGPNGARGSIKNLRRIGVRSVIGHSHTPAIDEGCYQTGTMTRLRLEYNSGPSSWLNTHCLIYPNGKRTLLNIIEGDWKT